jgi:acetyl-CoA carboxylase biotin carboxyl carrier protein
LFEERPNGAAINGPTGEATMGEQETLQPAAERGENATAQQPGEKRGGRDRVRRRHQPQQSQGRRPEPLLNLDELRDLVELIAEHGFTDFELEREGIRVRLRRDLAPQNATSAHNSQASLEVQLPSAPQPGTPPGGGLPPTAPHPGAQAEVAASADEGLYIITSPIVGTFYRSPSPTAESFVNLGSKVESDSVVCIIEAMKLMNEIQAETSGEVAKIYVENGQPVEYGQPLFGIRK